MGGEYTANFVKKNLREDLEILLRKVGKGEMVWILAIKS